MKKRFTKWFISLLILISTSNSFANLIKIKSKTYSNIVIKNDKLYSKSCKQIQNCFTTPEKLKLYQNQNPLFSLCFQSKGTPHFVQINSEKSKRQVCLKDKHIVDLNSLMLLYKRNKGLN